MFSYELPNVFDFDLSTRNNSILVYNFHSLLNHDRLFIFCSNFKSLNTSSISEIFYSANWLERENSELHGINFSGKKDLRNLLLQYGDNSYPFQKAFPSVGLREMFFNSVKDTLIQSNISSQI